MPVLPFIPAIIGGVGALVGAKSGGPTGQQKRALSASEQLALTQQQNAQQAAELGKQYSAMSTPALTNALNYWQTLLSGDRTAMSTALGPEIQQYSQGQQSALNNTQQFAPRSGARASMVGEQPFQTAQTIGNMFATLRPAAAGQVGNLGMGLAGLGLQGYGAATSGNQAASNDYLNLITLGQALKNNQIGIGSQVGQGLYTWAKGVDWGKIFGGAKNGGGGGINPGDPNDPSICWVAEALYGPGYETELIRAWLKTVYRKTLIGGILVALYATFGQRVALWVKKYPLARRIASMPFSAALGRAKAWVVGR